MKKKAFTWLVILAMFVSVFAGMNLTVSADEGDVYGLEWKVVKAAPSSTKRTTDANGEYTFSPINDAYNSAGFYLYDAIKEAVGDDGTGTFELGFKYRGTVKSGVTAPTCSNFRSRCDSNTGLNPIGDIYGVKFDGTWQTVSKTFTINNWQISDRTALVTEDTYLCFGTITNPTSLQEVQFKDTYVIDADSIQWKSYNSSVTRRIVKDNGEYCYAFTGSQMNYQMGLPLNDAVRAALPVNGTGKVRISYDFRVAGENATTVSGVTAMRDGSDGSNKTLGNMSPTSGDLTFTTVWKHVTFEISFTNFKVADNENIINDGYWARFNSQALNGIDYELRFKNTKVERVYSKDDINGLEWKSVVGTTVRSFVSDELTGEACYSFSPIGQFSSAGLYIYDAIEGALGENGTGTVKISFKYRGIVKDGMETPTCNSFRSRRDDESNGSNRMGDINGVTFDGTWHTVTAVFKLNNWVVQDRGEAIGEKEYLCFGTITNASSLQAVHFKDASVERIYTEDDINGLEWKSVAGTTVRSFVSDELTGEACYSFSPIGQFSSAGLYVYDAIDDALGANGTGTVRISFKYRGIVKDGATELPTCNSFRARREGESAGANRMGDFGPVIFDGAWHEVTAMLRFDNWVVSGKNEAIDEDEYLCFGTVTNASSLQAVYFKDASIERVYTEDDIDGLEWKIVNAAPSSTTRTVGNENGKGYYSFSSINDAQKSAGFYLYNAIKAAVGDDGTGAFELGFKYRGIVKDGMKTPTCYNFRSRRDSDLGSNPIGDISGVTFDDEWQTVSAIFTVENWCINGNTAITADTYLCFGTITDYLSLQEMQFKDTYVIPVNVDGLEWKSYKSNVTRKIVKDELCDEYCYAFTGQEMNGQVGLPLYDAILEALPGGTGCVKISFDFRTAGANATTISGVTALRDGSDVNNQTLGDMSPTSGDLTFASAWKHVTFEIILTDFRVAGKTNTISNGYWARFNSQFLNNINCELRFKNTKVEGIPVEGLSWDKQSNVVKKVELDRELNEAYYSFTGFNNSTDRWNCIKSASVYNDMKDILGDEGTGWVKFSFDYAVDVADGTTPFTGFRSRNANIGDIVDISGSNIILDGNWHTAMAVLSFDGWNSEKNETIADGTYLCAGTIADGLQGNIKEIKIKNTKVEKGSPIDVQLEISNSLTFKIYACVDDFADSYTPDKVAMNFTRNGHTDAVNGTQEDGRFCFEYKVNPQCMGDDCKMQLCVDGIACAPAKTFSVKTYCTKLYDMCQKETVSNPEGKLVKLLADMLAYGEQAQKFTGYNVDKLVTNGLSWVNASKSKDVTIFAKDITKDTANHGTNIKGASLSLGDTVRIFFKVTAEQADNAALFEVNGEDETPVTTFETIPGGESAYIYTDGIYYNNLAKVYKLAIGNDSVKYNANAYIAAKCNDENVGDIIKALAAYGASAKDYGTQPYYEAQQWVSQEITFTSGKTYASTALLGTNPQAFDVIQDVEFTNEATKTTLKVPAFWDGGNTWRVRFAPTEIGEWKYTTECPQDKTLDGLTGTVSATAYTGNLDIYKHGFVTSSYGQKYFTYADGKPFFYLGDTHWTMLSEEFDVPGEHAGTITDPHFKYIVDKRVSQGFTVYQSEPLNGRFGLGNSSFDVTWDLEGLQKADKYFAYIAEKGMVHANAMLFFVTELDQEFAQDEEYLEKISRYWVARYGSYPVMWTLAQEVDNDCNAERSVNPVLNYVNNPWLKIAEYVHKYDAYAHPLTGHQESTTNTTVTGRGTTAPNKDNNGASIFLSDDVTKRTGHDWFAAQWKPDLAGNVADYTEMAKDYWASSKIAVNYEGRYVYLWTDDFGGRVQGWLSYLNGFYGYGYGCQDIWYYKSNYDMDAPTELQDGRSIITVADKQKYWSETVNAESSRQCGYMKDFFSEIEWWKLGPDFDSNAHFIPETGTLSACAASDDDDTIVIYSYNENTKFGTVCGLDENATYTARWFNTRMGAFDDSRTVTIENVSYYQFTAKPDSNDWALLITKS